MLGRTNTGVGGAGGLNFQVIGSTTAPNNPKENTIWIETDTEISSWVLSPVQPEAVEGLAWISIGGASEYAFNALKKNALMVYPVSVMHYNGTEWKNVDAYIYQKGAWVKFSLAWDGYYFKDGNQYENITGGWSSEGYKYYDYSMKSATVGDTLSTRSSGNYTASMIGTYTSVDLTNVDAITVAVDNVLDSSFAIMKSKQLSATDFLISLNAGNQEIDVSGLTGNYYLAIASAGGQTIPNAYATVSAIWRNSAASDGNSGIALLSLDNTPGDDVVNAIVDDVGYGVTNATINEEPTKETYDFTVL